MNPILESNRLDQNNIHFLLAVMLSVNWRNRDRAWLVSERFGFRSSILDRHRYRLLSKNLRILNSL